MSDNLPDGVPEEPAAPEELTLPEEPTPSEEPIPSRVPAKDELAAAVREAVREAVEQAQESVESLEEPAPPQELTPSRVPVKDELAAAVRAAASERPSGSVTGSAQVERQAWISWLRFAAIVAVVLIHVGGFTAAAKPDDQWLDLVATALDFCSRWAVPLFVMVSGALLLDPARYPGNRVFLRKRVLRLVPALIFWHATYYVYLVIVEDRHFTTAEVTRRVLTGELYTALYFFWLILGLAAVTPILVPWMAAASHRMLLGTALVAMAVPAYMVMTAPLRNTTWQVDVQWVQTSFTWFIPYLGYYLLGFALRDVVLARLRLAAVAAVGIAGCVLLTWQWGNVNGFGGRIERYAPAEAYYTPTVMVVTACVFLVGRATIRPGGRLGWFARGRLARIGGALGGATLGVFVVHLLVFRWVRELIWIGGPKGAESIGQLVARCVVVLVVAYAISLTMSKIPLLRRLV